MDLLKLLFGPPLLLIGQTASYGFAFSLLCFLPRAAAQEYGDYEAYYLATYAGPAVSVDKMTCAQAQKYVRKYGMYWLATGSDGAIPISFVSPFNRTAPCEKREVFAFHQRATRDNPRCVVGVTCRAGY